jgi:sucrose-6-phosphate hydrolase SacC (GH32 family)
MRTIIVGISLTLLVSSARGEEGGHGGLRLVLLPQGEMQMAPHGRGNVYAPEIHFENGIYRMWFGGQGRDGHDRIQLAESTDALHWRQRGVVLEDQSANHVNDPSVVRVGNRYFMYFTRAHVDIRDEIAVATSEDGVHWTKRGIAIAPSPEPNWDSLLVGRPSVLVENGRFRMWYDGRKDLPPGAPATGVPVSAGSERAVGYAESRDGLHWVRPQREPVFKAGAGGVQVSHLGKRLLMVYESHEGTLAAVSDDGQKWKPRGLLRARSGDDADQHGHVTPFLLYRSDRSSAWLFVGAARSAAWDENVIGRCEILPAQLQTVLE